MALMPIDIMLYKYVNTRILVGTAISTSLNIAFMHVSILESYFHSSDQRST